ncbi:MAG: tape measure protein [Alphaproteobacteria bacterium]|nr:tape measure protein [Alphaproteobacteria bacterium]
MSDITFGVTLKADGSGLVGEFRLSEQAAKGLREELGKTDAAARRGGQGTEAFAAGAAKSGRSARTAGEAVEDLGRDFDRAGRAAREGGQAMGGQAAAADRSGAASRRAAHQTDAYGRASRRAARGADDLRGSVLGVRAAVTALGLGIASREYLRLADAAIRTESQLRNVTASAEELTATQAKLFDLAQETRTAYESTVELYARVARSSERLGVSQRELLLIAEATNKAIQVSGATAAEATAGVIQFAQGLASGELRGEELRSVMEQLPRLAKALVDGIDGVDDPNGLREMAEDGRLTTDVVLPALLSQLEAVRDEFDNIDRTSSQAWTQLRNDLLRSIGVIDEAEGTTADLAGALDDIRATVATPEFRDGVGAIVGLMGDIVALGGDAVAVLGAVNRELKELTGGDLALFGDIFDLLDAAGGDADVGSLLKDRLELAFDFYAGVYREIKEGLRDLRDPNRSDARAEAREASVGALGDLRRNAPAAPAAASTGAGRPAVRDEIREEVDAIFEQAAALTRLTLAYGESAEAVREAEVAHEALGIVRKAGADLSLEEYQAVSRAAFAYAEAKRALDDAKEAQREQARAAEEAARAHVQAVAEIERAGLALLTPYERAIAEANRWRDEQLAALDATKAGYREFADEVARIHGELIVKAQEEQLERSREWSDGMRTALRDYADEATNAARNAERATLGALTAMEDAFVRWATTGKLSARDLVNSVLADLARLTVRQNITGPLAETLAGGLADALGGVDWFGGGWSAGTGVQNVTSTNTPATAPAYHAGGTVGGPSQLARRLDAGLAAAAIAAAPRFHSGGLVGGGAMGGGLGPRERLIVAETGERIFTPQQLDNADRLMRAALIDRRRGGEAGSVRIDNHYDFRGADASVLARLQATAARIRDESVAQATAAVRGMAREGGGYAEDLARISR